MKGVLARLGIVQHEYLTEGLAKAQVVLARQLANQAPSQLPLQRLTSEQMQQLQLQVQQDRQRQVSWAPSSRDVLVFSALQTTPALTDEFWGCPVHPALYRRKARTCYRLRSCQCKTHIYGEA